MWACSRLSVPTGHHVRLNAVPIDDIVLRLDRWERSGLRGRARAVPGVARGECGLRRLGVARRGRGAGLDAPCERRRRRYGDLDTRYVGRRAARRILFVGAGHGHCLGGQSWQRTRPARTLDTGEVRRRR